MVALISGVTKAEPVPTGEPPVAAVYQLMVVPILVLAVTAKVTEPASQRLAAVAPDIVGAIVLIVANTAVLLADKQPFAVTAPA